MDENIKKLRGVVIDLLCLVREERDDLLLGGDFSQRHDARIAEAEEILKLTDET